LLFGTSISLAVPLFGEVPVDRITPTAWFPAIGVSGTLPILDAEADAPGVSGGTVRPQFFFALPIRRGWRCATVVEEFDQYEFSFYSGLLLRPAYPPALLEHFEVPRALCGRGLLW
jgi:hypothetical protein